MITFKGNQYSRARVVMAGVFLVFVPTAFTMFPTWQHWSVRIRILVIALWTLVAAFAVLSSREHERNVKSLSDRHTTHLRALGETAFVTILESLLRPGTSGFPDDHEFTVYLHDETSTLTPIWPAEPPNASRPDIRAFEVGNGATGTAWKKHFTVVVRGDEVANAAYGLTPEQQDFYKDFRVAAATPIFEDAEKAFGVLTVLGKKDNGFLDAKAAGPAVLRELAAVVAIVLTSIKPLEDVS